jgi:hypothetical protein
MVRKSICNPLRQALILTLLIIIGLVQPRSVSQAQTPTPTRSPATNFNWSEPMAFERAGWFPDITTDASGRLYVAWSNNVIFRTITASSYRRDGYDIVLLSTSENGGGTWSPIGEVAALKEILPGSVEVTRPALLADSKGIFHMTYRDYNLHYSQVPVQQIFSAQNWLKPVQMNTNSLAYFSRLNVDSKGRLHLVYTEDVPSGDCTICYHVFYRYSDNGGVDWSQDTDISVVPTGAAKPQILVDAENNIHVVWEAGRGGSLGQLTNPTAVMYTVSYNRGESWTQPIEFSAPKAEFGKNIVIGEDGKGSLVVAWSSGPGDYMYYQASIDHGLSWSNPEQIPDVRAVWDIYQSRLDDYTMATDSAGKIHMVMVGRLSNQDQNLRLLHLVWNGTGWSAPEEIISYNGDSPEWPRLAVSKGNQLNLVWYVRPKDSIWAAVGDYYKVYYSHSILKDAPVVQPTAWPTLLPPTAIAAAASPTPQNDVTPLPTVLPLNTVLDPNHVAQSSYTEAGQLGVLAVSLVPVLLVVGVLLFVILFLRRR